MGLRLGARRGVSEGVPPFLASAAGVLLPAGSSRGSSALSAILCAECRRRRSPVITSRRAIVEADGQMDCRASGVEERGAEQR